MQRPFSCVVGLCDHRTKLGPLHKFHLPLKSKRSVFEISFTLHRSRQTLRTVQQFPVEQKCVKGRKQLNSKEKTSFRSQLTRRNATGKTIKPQQRIYRAKKPSSRSHFQTQRQLFCFGSRGRSKSCHIFTTHNVTRKEEIGFQTPRCRLECFVFDHETFISVFELPYIRPFAFERVLNICQDI